MGGFFNNCPIQIPGFPAWVRWGNTWTAALTLCTRSIGWALFGVNFRPLQEIEAIMGGRQIFDTGPFFARLRYNDVMYENFSRIKNFSWAETNSQKAQKFDPAKLSSYTVVLKGDKHATGKVNKCGSSYCKNYSAHRYRNRLLGGIPIQTYTSVTTMEGETGCCLWLKQS